MIFSNLLKWTDVSTIHLTLHICSSMYKWNRISSSWEWSQSRYLWDGIQMYGEWALSWCVLWIFILACSGNDTINKGCVLWLLFKISCIIECTINGGHQGNSQSQGTCEHGNICTSYGNCIGKQVLNIPPSIVLRKCN